MAFVVEDGTGLDDSNSYVSVVYADDYYSLHLYPGKWATADNAKKEKALAQSTRMIDASFVYKGNQNTTLQALKWPRYGVVLPYDPNAPDIYSPKAENQSQIIGTNLEIASNVIPKQLKDAVCEFARWILEKDRDKDLDKPQVKRQKVASLEREFFDRSPSDNIPESVQRLLAEIIISEPTSGGNKSSYVVMGRA